MMAAGRPPLALRAVRVVAGTVAALCGGVLAAQAAGAAGLAGGSPAAPAGAAAKPVKSSAFHQTRTVTRINLIDGKNEVVDKRKVTLNVNVTSDLIDRQILTVSWSGAHPTGGIQTNPNDGANAQYQEYPMVLLECHGYPFNSKPLAKQITPQDCYTATPTERFFSASADAPFPPWRLDRYATAAGQRNLTVGQPAQVPASCGLLSGPHFWLNYITPGDHGYPVGPAGCAGMPNEMSLLGGLGILPSNETFAATHLNGRGSASFDVWTSEVNPDLGCSQHLPCALVAIPIMGISCDPAAAKMPPDDRPSPAQEPAAAALCEEKGHFAPGSPLGSGELGQQDVTVAGELWWAASNWRNRFVVPLHFAPPGNICSIVNKSNHFVQIFGSELMDQAALQWQPHFCLNKKLFTLGYVGESEPEAAGNLISGTADAALVSDQPATPFPGPVIHAPVAATAFAISFVIDNANGVPVTTLRLDPRLLAKLLTESYPGVAAVADEDPEILHHCPGVPVSGEECTNPLNITLDPEFQALNPGITKGVGASAAASVMLALSTQSDVMRALTSYINDNPAARAWLNGKPDPWGMTVNSAYKGIKLPTSLWPLLSTFEPADWLTGTGGGPGLCYSLNPSPVLPLIAAPIPDLPDIAEDVQFYIAQSQLACAGNPSIPQSEHLTALGPQTVGFRFMLGITSLADARRYAVRTASLLTYTKPGTPDKFTSARGMTFVAPTDAAMRAAAALLRPDKTGHDWVFPYALYQKDDVKAATAYPGTMLVYADIPTKGLPAADAADYARFIRFAATAGQVPGGDVGQLPAGYLPMTAADHLGAQARYAAATAGAVAAQKGAIPALTTGAGPSPSPSPSSTDSGSGTGTGTGSGSGTGTGTGSGGTSPGPAGTSPAKSPSPGPSGSGGPLALTPEANFGLAGYAVPVIAGLGLAAAIGALAVSRLTRSRGKKWS